MAKVTYPGDATERNSTTLESLGMEFMGYDSVTKAALRTTYTNLKLAILGGGGLPSYIEDADQDTKVETEKTADDDTIRFSTLGVERGIVEPGGKLQWTQPLDLNGGVSGAAPAPQITMGTYLDNSGNPSISHIDLYNAEFGIGITSDELNIITKDMIKMYDVDDLATALVTLDSGNSKFSSYHPFHVGVDDTQAIYIPDQTNFLGTMVVGNEGSSLSHVSGNEGKWNLLFGIGCGRDLSTGDGNCCVGYQAGMKLTTGSGNFFLGVTAAREVLGGSNNFIAGRAAGRLLVSGNNNVFVGFEAGRAVLGSGSICLGNEAGRSETGSNKLYIENSDSATPLIYGEFDNDIIKINGELQTSIQLTLDEQAGDPTQQANKGLLYTKDVSAVTELFYMRSDGTTVQLT